MAYWHMLLLFCSLQAPVTVVQSRLSTSWVQQLRGLRILSTGLCDLPGLTNVVFGVITWLVIPRILVVVMPPKWNTVFWSANINEICQQEHAYLEFLNVTPRPSILSVFLLLPLFLSEFRPTFINVCSYSFTNPAFVRTTGYPGWYYSFTYLFFALFFFFSFQYLFALELILPTENPTRVIIGIQKGPGHIQVYIDKYFIHTSLPFIVPNVVWFTRKPVHVDHGLTVRIAPYPATFNFKIISTAPVSDILRI